jgi:hypothetical protein
MVKRAIVIVIGVILLLGGLVTAVAGGALMALFGSSSTLSSGQGRVATSTNGLVTAMDDIKGTSGFASTVDQPTLRVSVNGAGREVFIGIGPAAAVDRYLSGSSVDKVTDFEVDPFRLKTVHQAGTAQPQPPSAQTFWTAQASRRQATLNWKISDGSYRLVVMNADVSPGLTVDGKFALTIPHLFAIGIGILVAGILVTLVGLLILVLGLRMRQGRPDARYAGAGGTQGYQPPAVNVRM